MQVHMVVHIMCVYITFAVILLPLARAMCFCINLAYLTLFVTAGIFVSFTLVTRWQTVA